MANVTITQLPAAGPITGTELVPIVQNGQTVRTTSGAIAASPAQTQTFLTLNQEPSLPNSRYLQGGTGVGLVDAGALSYLQIVLNGASGSLEAASNGIIVKTGSASVTNRSIAVSGDGLSIVNGNGLAGNPTIALTGLALAIAQVSGTGMLAVVGGTVIAGRSLLGTANQIDIANGDGSNSPVFSLASNAILPGTGAVTVPVGTTAQRPTGQDGMIRYNTDINTFEVWDSGSWTSLPAGAVTLINTGAGLTGGPITSSGTIAIANTGVAPATYGTAAAAPQIVINAQGQITSATEVTISPAAIGAVASVSGTADEIDATGTTNVVLSLPTNLTFTGKTVTNGTFNMVAATVNSIPVATTEGVETLKNKTISGADNTLSNIGNASLTNSSVTYNGVSVALGASGTITATTTNALTVSTGLQLNSGTTFDGSAARTISIDSTVATLTGVQALTNKTIDGNSNTLQNIGNASLQNSSITIGSTNVSLGGTASTVGGLTLTTPTIAQIINTGTLTLPTSTDTLVARDTVDTLKNKTISGSDNTLSNIGNASLSNSSISFSYSGGITGSSPVSLGGTNTMSLSNVPNSSLQYSSITLGSTSVALGGTSSTIAGLTSVTVTQPPSSALQLATKQYVDDAVSAGITIHSPVRVETPTALNATYTPGGTSVTVTDITGGTTLTFSSSPSLSVNDQIVFSSSSNGIVAGTAYYVYSVPAANQVTLSLSYNGPEITTFTNGTGLTIAGLVNAGVGATLTNAGTKAALQIDGVSLSVTNRVLVYNQTNAYENGIYTVTTVGTPDPGGTNWVLTRATTEDKYQPDSTSGIGQGDYFFVQEGATGAGESYVLTTNNPLIIGTTNLTFTQFSASVAYSAGTGLTLSGTQFSITNTGVSAASYGTASSVPTIAVNAQGQITSASNTSIAINANQITSGSIQNSQLQNSAITVNSTSISLGGSATITAANPNALTIGTGLSGSSYDGSAPITIAISNTGVSAATYGSASSVPVIAVNAQGQITSASNSSISIDANQITSGTVDSARISGSYTGITGVGTLAAGTWNASTIGVAYGGTGATTLTGYVYGNGTGAFTASTSIPNSATTATSANTPSAIVARDGSGNFSAGTITASLSGNATTATTATNIASGATGSLPYQTGSGATTFLALGTQGYMLRAGASGPEWAVVSGGTF